jgi:hypothetical protein
VGTLRALDDVNDMIDLDVDVANFQINDLHKVETDEIINTTVLQQSIDLASSEKQCAAMHFASDPRRKKRCGGYPQKGQRICASHFKRTLAGKEVVLFDDDQKALK